MLDGDLQVFDFLYMLSGPCDVLNGDCEQICIPIGVIRICECEYGFTLENDRRSCSSGKLDRVLGWVSLSTIYPQ